MGTTMEGYSLSKRLSCVADWIKDTGHRCVADIGTDHGYLPVYLAKNNIADRVIAMDVRIQPLNKAESNVRLYGVQEKVELRLSDGLDELKPLEADTITICGMGGRLIQSILTRGKDMYPERKNAAFSEENIERAIAGNLAEIEAGTRPAFLPRPKPQPYRPHPKYKGFLALY